MRPWSVARVDHAKQLRARWRGGGAGYAVMMLMTAKVHDQRLAALAGLNGDLGDGSMLNGNGRGLVFLICGGSANLLLRCGVTVLQSVAGCSGALPFERRIARPAGK
jgi:hypothetical protein